MQENAIDFAISFTKNIKRYLEKMAFFYTLCDGHRLILACMVLAGYGFLRRRQTITQKSPWNYSFVTRIGSLTRGGEIPESFQKERKNVTMCFKSLANSLIRASWLSVGRSAPRCRKRNIGKSSTHSRREKETLASLGHPWFSAWKRKRDIYLYVVRYVYV